MRALALTASDEYFESGSFFDDLARRVAYRTESPDPDQRSELDRYLDDELTPCLNEMGFSCQKFENPIAGGGPFLVARRFEGEQLPTVMTYGHADVVLGDDDQWSDNRSPWVLEQAGDRLYGRGSADNKAQHTINLAAMRSVLEVRGSMEFNVVALFETGEECGSPGLREFCAEHLELFEADVFVASDGPRVSPDTPTVFMGSRGAFNFTMTLELRDAAHHSGNWGGLLANPGIVMANALASMVDANGQVLVEGWTAQSMTPAVRHAISTLTVGGGEGDPVIDPNWGAPDYTPAERVFGTNTFEVLAFETGNPRNPVNAIPSRAVVHGHLRFVVGTRGDDLLPALRRHLDDRGFNKIELTPAGQPMEATRLDPSHPWAQWAIESIERTTETAVAVLPNLGGSLPNDVFAELLSLPTIWVPHSYPGCSQHAPDEHVPAPVCREGLQIMTGLWWDLGEPTSDRPRVSR